MTSFERFGMKNDIINAAPRVIVRSISTCFVVLSLDWFCFVRLFFFR